jgi:hypothetical protein
MLGTERHIRVVQTETGGGFCGKEEYPSMIAGHATLLALKSGRPVKIVYDREEDMVATTKRHPSIVRHRTGVTRDGRLTAMDVQIVLDGGAYVTLSPTVLSRGGIHAAGPYRCDNTRIDGRAMFTNTPPNGAFRGFGAPQTQFAVEAHMERVAEALVTDEVSIGDYVLSGGEPAALVVIDSAIRLLPGALGSETSATTESFSDGLLDYPHYTRPREWRGKKVPDVLLSGNHAEIGRWRAQQAKKQTAKKRPEMLKISQQI